MEVVFVGSLGVNYEVMYGCHVVIQCEVWTAITEGDSGMYFIESLLMREVMVGWTALVWSRRVSDRGAA